MNIDSYQKLSSREPFITVAILGLELSRLVTTGDGLTKLAVVRVGKPYEVIVLSALEQIGNTITFAATKELLEQPRGRYEYTVYFKGNYLGKKQFVLEQPEVEINNV